MLSLQLLRSRLYRSCRQLYLRPAPALNLWCSIPSAHTVQVPTLPLGYRTLATSKRSTGKRTPSTFRLRTLRPERLSAVGQEVIDLSGKVLPVAPTVIDGHRIRCTYGVEHKARERFRRVHFPEGTRGFFYFHCPADGRELHAGVRFRICESAAEFARGRDLLGARGNVWGPTVLEMVKHKERRAFLALCRAEQLIDEALIADLNRLDISDTLGRYQYLLSDPFDLNLQKTKRQITYVRRTKLARLFFPQKVSRTPSDFYPLTGTIKVQFELSNLPEHEELGPTLVLRVLDIVDPIAVDPHYNAVPDVPVPVPGMLVQRKTHGWLRALAIPLKLQPMAEDLLALAKTTWAR